MNQSTPGTVRATVYPFQGPGGDAWTHADNGIYTINLLDGVVIEVADDESDFDRLIPSSAPQNLTPQVIDAAFDSE